MNLNARGRGMIIRKPEATYLTYYYFATFLVLLIILHFTVTTSWNKLHLSLFVHIKKNYVFWKKKYCGELNEINVIYFFVRAKMMLNEVWWEKVSGIFKYIFFAKKKHRLITKELIERSNFDFSTWFPHPAFIVNTFSQNID